MELRGTLSWTCRPLAKFSSKKEMVMKQGTHLRDLETEWRAVLQNCDQKVNQMLFQQIFTSMLQTIRGVNKCSTKTIKQSL